MAHTIIDHYGDRLVFVDPDKDNRIEIDTQYAETVIMNRNESIALVRWLIEQQKIDISELY